jgi:hypothetical protein
MKKYFLVATLLFAFGIQSYSQIGGCTPICNKGDSIMNFSFGHQLFINDSCSASGYSDYSKTQYFYGEPGVNYELAIDWDFFSTNNGVIWIDWNNDNVFSIIDEIYRLPNGKVGTRGVTEVTVPTTATANDTVAMRVSIIINSSSGNESPCVGSVASRFYECEDYSLILSKPPADTELKYCVGEGHSNQNPTDCLTDGGDPSAQANFWLGEFGIDGQFLNGPTSCGADNGYTDYTNDFLGKVLPGQNYTGTAVSEPYAGSAAHAATIWVDWNQDYDFDDADEVFQMSKDNRTANIVSGFIYTMVVPPTALVGITRMRVRTWPSNFIGSLPDACDGHIRGEVEDYTIQVGDLVQCATHSTPTDNQQNVCTNNVMLTWSTPAAGPAPTGYKVFLGTDVNATTLVNGQDVALNTSYVFPNALPPDTKYFWKIVAYNADGDAYGCAVDSFTTAMSIDPSIDQILLGGNDVDLAAVCADVDLAILATISGGTGTVDAAWTVSDDYLDNNPSNNPNFNTANNPSFTSADANKTYTLRLTATDDNFCSARDSVKVYVKPAVEVGTLSADKAAVCANETVTLTLTGYNATITDWEKAEGANPYASVSHTQDVLATTINVNSEFKVLLTNGAGCEGESNQVTVTLKAAPAAPTISVSPANTACEGDVITLTASLDTDIVWNDAGSSTTNPIEVSNNGTFNVTYTDPVTNCSATSSNEVITFNALPANPIISLVGVTCEGETVTLSTQYSTDLSWDLNESGTASTATTDVTQDGTYTVTYTDVATNCSSLSDKQITFTAKPAAPIIEQKGDSLITNPLQIVDWLDADGNVVFTGDSYSPDRTPDQTFTAVATDGNDCESDESDEVAYDHTVSIARYSQIDFAVFPNPATSELNVQVHSSNAAGMYQIKDMAGRTVIAVELVSGINTISLSEIQSGIYMLQNSVGNTIRIVKQ